MRPARPAACDYACVPGPGREPPSGRARDRSGRAAPGRSAAHPPRLSWRLLAAAGLAASLLCAPLAAAPPGQVELCAACHGVGGVSEMENVPSLAAQPEAFLRFQINLFRERIRTVEPMATAAEGLTDADVAALARYYAALPPPPPAVADPERARRGRELSAELRCAVCHGDDYAGRNQMPRLASQREDYLLHAMRDYQAGTRQGAGAQMQQILRGITDQELADLAHFFATVPASP